MKKQFIKILILVFLLNLIPLDLKAISEDKINASVQIICPDNYGNLQSGSGTIIDPKGIILTNKHVVTDKNNAIIKTCVIGFVRSIAQAPDFGTEDNPNWAEVKYYTASEDMDAAILYLNNLSNASYSYVDIWGSDSSKLKFGDKIEIIGYPSIGGSTITYTSGDFSGFGSSFDGTQNYIKTTAPIEHGNSGGSAYGPNGQFIGIPTAVVSGELNSLSYVLSINSIKNWLLGIWGNDYKQEIIRQKPEIEDNKIIDLKDDITPPTISFSGAPKDFFGYQAFDDNGNKIQGDYGAGYQQEFLDLYEVNEYGKIQIIITSTYQRFYKMDTENGVYSAYYTYSDNLNKLNSTFGNEYVITDNRSDISGEESLPFNYFITPLITLPDKEGVYYIGLRFKDKSGNVSNQIILTYVYEKNNFLGLKNIKFYSDSGYKKMIGNYDFTMKSEPGFYPEYYQYCATKYKNVYVKWEYDKNYPKYAVKYYNKPISSEDSAYELALEGGIISTNSNKYSVLNLDKASGEVGVELCNGNNCAIYGNHVSSLLLKPGEPILKGINTVVKFVYNPDLSFSFKCGEFKYRGYDFSADLIAGKPLIEDNLTFDNNQNIIANSGTLGSNVPQSSIDNSLVTRLKGKILLQVESVGEAWYLNPDDGKRYYMKDGATAYQMMRNFGLGITNVDLAKIPQEGEKNNYPSFVNKLKGKILLQVESVGEAWYVNPKTGYRHYMKDGAAAYNLMRYYSLGIANKDLEKIPVGAL